MVEEQKKHAYLYRNAVSYFGALISAGSLLLIVFILALEFSMKRTSPYLGIFTYMVFPMFFAVGIGFFLYGMRRESIRRRKAGTEEALPYPRIDLNDPDYRKKFSYIVLGGTCMGILMAFVTYNAFLYTESVSFCGVLCHTVMEPEHAAYLASPHAKVRCVYCHDGQNEYRHMKEKILEMLQFINEVWNSFTTPIQ